MSEMTPRQRLLTAMRRGRPDRVPLHVRGMHVWNDEWVVSRDKSYSPVIDAVRRQGDPIAWWSPRAGRFLSAAAVEQESAVTTSGDWDVHETVLRTPAGPLRSVRHVSRKGMPGLTTRFWIETIEDVQRFLSLPYEPAAPETASFFALQQRLGESALPLVTLNNPAAWVHELLGSERLAIWSIQERAVVSRLMGIFAERVHELVRSLLDAGVRGAFGFSGEEYLGPPLQSPRDFREWVAAIERPVADLLHRHECLLNIHCHGPMQAILEEFAAMGTDCLHPIEAPPLGDMPLAEAKRRIGRDVCLEGNIQIGDIYSLTPEAVRDVVRRAMDDAAAGGGFILCPTASPYTPTLEPRVVENYLALVDAAREFGRY